MWFNRLHRHNKFFFFLIAALGVSVLTAIEIAVRPGNGILESLPGGTTTKAYFLYYSDRLSPAKALERKKKVSDPRKAVFNDPCSVIVDDHGRLFFSERRSHLIRMIEHGRLSIFAGNLRKGYNGDGAKATSARLQYPEGLALDNQANLFVADSANHRIRMIDRAGIISTFAGNGIAGFSGDGKSAKEAELNKPMDVAFGPNGNLYIADWGNHRIRKVTKKGIITTVAGTGAAGYDGDGRPALEASLNGPYGVAVDSHGNLYVADSGNHRVRIIGTDGIIHTIAGTGIAGFFGDGGLATSAQLDSPQALFIDIDGDVYINDEHNHRIRIIDKLGNIFTLAGNGKTDLCGDGGLASNACLYDPEDIWIDALRNIYIADGDNHRLRIISPDGIIQSIAGSGPIGKKTKP